MLSTYTTRIMEKAGGHYVGNAADGLDHHHGSEDAHSASNTSALDFAGMLDAADSVFHQQIYEYLQGPALQQQQAADYHQFLSSSLAVTQGAGSTFPAQTQYISYNHPAGPSTSTSSLPALTSTFQTLVSIPEQLPLQSAGHDVISFIDTSSSPPHLSLSRRDGSTTLESRGKEHQSIEQLPGIDQSAAGMGVTAHWPVRSSSALDSAQMTYTAANMFQPPAHQQQLPPPSAFAPNGREFLANETSCSPNGHVKRPGGGEPADALTSSPRPRGRKAPKIEPTVATEEWVPVVKPQRPPEQAEHIIRERLRRGDMTSKYLILESLLPPGPKRDRSTVVEESIQYVKTLHHRVNELHEKRSEVKSNTISGYRTCRRPNLDQFQDQVAKKMLLNPVITSRSDQSNALAMSSSGSAIEKIDVHLDLPHQVVIEMTCRPHRHIQSQIMKALERLGTDISRCSISKMHNRLICVMAVKPREMTEPLLTNDGVTGALMRAIVPY